MNPALLRRMSQAHTERPADYRANLPLQARFEACNKRRVLVFAFNGSGKSEIGARRLVKVLEGKDKIVEGVRRPINVIITVSGYESLNARDFAEQLYILAPPGLLAQVDVGDDGKPLRRSTPWYGPGRGFCGRPPRIVVQRGPLIHSTINVGSLGSGELASAGGTVDLIIIIEPVTRALFEEQCARDRAGALGVLWYLMTPTPGTADQTWIPKWMADTGDAVAEFIQVPLTRENLTFPSGRALESWEEKTLPRVAGWTESSRAMRMGLSLEPILEDAYFAKVWRESLICDDYPDGLYLIGNLDHGLIEGRMRVGLTGFAVHGPIGARRLTAYDIIDLRGTGARIDEMADLFLRELDCHEIPLDQIDEWIGDRAIYASVKMVRRDNFSWRGAVQQALRRKARDETLRAPPSLWSIRTPSKRSGSNEYTKEQIRAAMSEEPPRIFFCRWCQLIQEDVQKWDGSRGSPHKDGLDRLGYGWEAAHRHFGLWRG